MTNFGDADLSAFFADMGQPIIYAGVTVQGMVDAYDARESGYAIEMVDRMVIVTVPSAGFANLAREAAVTVNGVAMVVRDILQKNDGGVTQFSAVLP